MNILNRSKFTEIKITKPFFFIFLKFPKKVRISRLAGSTD